MFTYVAFDTETTGTSVYTDSIIEIGAVRFVKGQAVDSFETFVNPGQMIPADATRVHGITNEMILDAPEIEPALERFSEFCGDDILVAHNAPFDVKFLSNAYLKHEVPTPQGRVFDTYVMAKKLLGELMNHRLQSLVKHYGIECSSFHRACSDSHYCGQVLLRLLFDLSRSKGILKMQHVIDLHDQELFFPVIEPKAKQLGLL